MQAKQKGKVAISDKTLLILLEILEEMFQLRHTFSYSSDDMPEDILMESFLYGFTVTVLRRRLGG